MGMRAHYYDKLLKTEKVIGGRTNFDIDFAQDSSSECDSSLNVRANVSSTYRDMDRIAARRPKLGPNAFSVIRRRMLPIERRINSDVSGVLLLKTLKNQYQEAREHPKLEATTAEPSERNVTAHRIRTKHPSSLSAAFPLRVIPTPKCPPSVLARAVLVHHGIARPQLLEARLARNETRNGREYDSDSDGPPARRSKRSLSVPRNPKAAGMRLLESRLKEHDYRDAERAESPDRNVRRGQVAKNVEGFKFRRDKDARAAEAFANEHEQSLLKKMDREQLRLLSSPASIAASSPAGSAY
eukprot:gene17762-21159_t